MTTKKRVLNAAKKLFVEHGYEKVSVRDIAGAAQVNVSAISYHFQGKEGLFKACLNEFGKEHLGFIEDATKIVLTKDDLLYGIRTLVNGLFELYTTNPQIIPLVLRALEKTGERRHEDVESIFLNALDRIADFFSRAQRNGVARADIKPDIGASILLGQILQSFTFDRKSEQVNRDSILNDPNYRASYQEQLVSILYLGILK